MKATTGQQAQQHSWRHLLLFVIAAAGSAVGYLLIGYGMQRHQTALLFGTLGVLLMGYLCLAWLAQKPTWWRWALGAAIAFRMLLFFSPPSLSDDVYRFVWDGRLLTQGINPFTYTPETLMAQGDSLGIAVDAELFTRLNSPGYHTIYPPVCQAIFGLSAWLSPNSWYGSALVMRLFFLLAELGTLWLLWRLLAHYQRPRNWLLWYAANPMIILELTGNLHFEGLMIFFTLLAVWWHVRGRQVPSALALALAVACKLIPLIFLPLLIRRLPLKKLLGYYAVCGGAILVFFAPLLGGAFVEGFGDSFALYFSNFEFNASVYYVVRWVGYHTHGYNIIQLAGKWLAIATFSSIMAYSLWAQPRRVPWVAGMLWVWGFYVLFATTLHPWYVAPLVALATLTRWRWPMVWSALIWLTYAGYTATGFQEILWLTAVEYTGAIGYLAVELWRNRVRNRGVVDIQKDTPIFEAETTP